MAVVPLERLLASTGGVLASGSAARFTGVVIDGRAAGPGALFFAIRGERFDGHDFAGQAVAAGAAGVVVARGRATGLTGLGGAAVIEVDDTVAALGRLARAHRQAHAGLRVVGVAGSNGKTTTKEMIAAILAAHAGPAAVLKTEGNLNNHLGVPLTLLRLDETHRYAVVEMGMSALGELAYLTTLVAPDVAVVVSIAAEHLEHLGSLENVARAEGEILVGLGPDAIGVVPADEPLLAPHAAHLAPGRRRAFGAGGDVRAADVAPSAEGLRFTLAYADGRRLFVATPLLGAHNAANAAAAAAVADVLGVPGEAVAAGLGAVRPAKHRAQLVAAGGRTILDDCYNASPLSMRAALDTLVAVTPAGRRKAALLGDMLELGDDTARLHAEVGAYAGGAVDFLVTFGELGRLVGEAAAARLGKERVRHAESHEEAARLLRAHTAPGDVVLIKASRGRRLEKVVELLATPETA
jgi:UDP-N-acetylmuramoyl-tripeptide--D-alanyl-D-alanine ligase